MRGDKVSPGPFAITCTGRGCCEQCATGHCCASPQGAISKSMIEHEHVRDSIKCPVHHRWECRKCGKVMSVPKEMGLNVGRTVAEEKAFSKKEQQKKVTNTKRPPTEVHIKDVETALHNLFCQDVGKNRINREAGLDLFDSHRKAANTLVEQLRLQGIKLVPDPDFEDKPPVCLHRVCVNLWDDVKKPYKERVKIGERCVACKKEALFA